MPGWVTVTGWSCEADESDGTFLKLPAAIAVVTNIDPEHLDHYGNFDNLRKAFVDFVENIPFYGFAALCIDHAEVQAMIAARLRPAHHYLRVLPAGGCARRECQQRRRRHHL